MGRILLVLSTLLVLIAIVVRNIRNNRVKACVFISLLKDINKTYVGMFKGRLLIGRVINTILLIVGGLLAFSSVYNTVISFITIPTNLILDILVKILVILFCLVIIHFSIGYLLLITTKINKFLHEVEDNNTKSNLLLSYFIISTFFAVFVIFPDQFAKDYLIGIIGLTTSYILNLRVLINLIKDPSNVKSQTKEGEIESFSMIIIASILILVMIILNLFLAVSLINTDNPGSFSNNPNNFDLFYYTIITFTTIGYGDITPISIPAKIIAIVISLTSVMCITIFLSTILSYRDKL